jgi:RNA polymerase sigma-70 factor (ECF subfamily)
MLDVPIGTIRSRLHRGRNLLKAELEEYAHDRGYKPD